MHAASKLVNLRCIFSYYLLTNNLKVVLFVRRVGCSLNSKFGFRIQSNVKFLTQASSLEESAH